MEDFLDFLMLNAIALKIKQNANKNLKKPFEVLVSVKKVEEGISVKNAMVCNN